MMKAAVDRMDGENDTATETSPLLSSPPGLVASIQTNGELSRIDSDHGPPKQAPQDEHLPIKQILLLCYARLVEPVAFFAIFPFINQMIYDTGEVPEARVGFYTGLIESLFSLTQMLAMLPWGRVADNPRVGRKPALVISLFGVSICMGLFGMSKKIWQMILCRCCAGLFAGTVVTIRTMISENSTQKTQAQAFGYFAFTGNLGIFLGPLVGGGLADPAREFPRVFGNSKFLLDNPYALPTFITGAIGLSAAAVCWLFLNETLKVRSAQSSDNEDDEKTSIRSLLQSPGVMFVLLLYGYIMVLAFSYTAVWPVFLFTPVPLGGLGLKPLYISIVMALGGLSQSIYLLLIFPWLQRRIGTGGVLRVCAIAYPFFFLAFPIVSVLLRNGLDAIAWTLLGIELVYGPGVAMSFTAIQLSLNDVNPMPETLGTLNAIALAFVSGIRSFSPALFTSIFAVGVDKEILRGYLVWLPMIIIAAGFIVFMRFMPPNAEGKVAEPITESEFET
jgi:MFS family permease